MSTYAIGDVQGCYEELRELLEVIDYSPTKDELWFVGDMINRGPQNAEVLDLIMSLPNVRCVLGNHDLHFLAIALKQQTQKRGDTLDDLLCSPKLPAYIEYLCSLPLLHHDTTRNIVLVHAGLPPQMSVSKCLDLAEEVEHVMRTPARTVFLKAMYGNEPAIWHEHLQGMDRLRVITNYFTRLRYCTADGQLDLIHKTDIQPPGFSPWFSFPRSDDIHILFGHWAALNGKVSATFVTALDTGCVWGRELTAVRLEDQAIFKTLPINQD